MRCLGRSSCGSDQQPDPDRVASDVKEGCFEVAEPGELQVVLEEYHHVDRRML